MSGFAIAAEDVEREYIARVYYHKMRDFSVKCDITVYTAPHFEVLTLIFVIYNYILYC